MRTLLLGALAFAPACADTSIALLLDETATRGGKTLLVGIEPERGAPTLRVFDLDSQEGAFLDGLEADGRMVISAVVHGASPAELELPVGVLTQVEANEPARTLPEGVLSTFELAVPEEEAFHTSKEVRPFVKSFRLPLAACAGLEPRGELSVDITAPFVFAGSFGALARQIAFFDDGSVVVLDTEEPKRANVSGVQAVAVAMGDLPSTGLVTTDDATMLGITINEDNQVSYQDIGHRVPEGIVAFNARQVTPDLVRFVGLAGSGRLWKWDKDEATVLAEGPPPETPVFISAENDGRWFGQVLFRFGADSLALLSNFQPREVHPFGEPVPLTAFITDPASDQLIVGAEGGRLALGTRDGWRELSVRASGQIALLARGDSRVMYLTEEGMLGFFDVDGETCTETRLADGVPTFNYSKERSVQLPDGSRTFQRVLGLAYVDGLRMKIKFYEDWRF